MNLALIINIIVLFLCAGIGIWEAKRLASRHPDLNLDTLHHKVRYIYIVVGLILITFLAIGIPMMNRTLMWHMPIWFDVYGHPLKFSLLIGAFAFLFSLASGVAMKTRHKESRQIVIASLLLVCAFPIFQYQYTHTVYPKLNHIKMKGVIFQSHPSSCAAASAANIAETLGIEKTEKEMAKLMNTSEMIGTNAGQIIHAMEQVGVQCSKRWVKNRMPSIFQRPPCFLWITRRSARNLTRLPSWEFTKGSGKSGIHWKARCRILLRNLKKSGTGKAWCAQSLVKIIVLPPRQLLPTSYDGKEGREWERVCVRQKKRRLPLWGTACYIIIIVCVDPAG